MLIIKVCSSAVKQIRAAAPSFDCPYSLLTRKVYDHYWQCHYFRKLIRGYSSSSSSSLIESEIDTKKSTTKKERKTSKKKTGKEEKKKITKEPKNKTKKTEKANTTTTNESKKTDFSIFTQSSLLERYASLNDKRKSSPSYVFSKDIAAEIASKVMKHRKNPSVPIIEYNPGPGLLTREFFRLGASEVIGIESKKDFLPYLQNVQEIFGEKSFTFHHWDPYMGNLLDARKMDKLNQNEMKSLWKIQPRKWTEDPYASIFGIVTLARSQTFLHFLQVLLSSKESLYSYGRPEMFLIVPVKYYRLMIVKDPTQEFWTYGKFSTIWNLFFDIETLLELHKSDVFPPFSIKRRLRVESKAFGTLDKDSVYLVKIVPKRDLPEITNCSEEYSRFTTFLGQILKNKKQRLIPKLESFVPGSGLHMIRMGFNMLHLTGEVPPIKYLEIYQKLSNLPEFKESSLAAILLSNSTETENITKSSIDQTEEFPS